MKIFIIENTKYCINKNFVIVYPNVSKSTQGNKER